MFRVYIYIYIYRVVDLHGQGLAAVGADVAEGLDGQAGARDVVDLVVDCSCIIIVYVLFKYMCVLLFSKNTRVIQVALDKWFRI